MFADLVFAGLKTAELRCRLGLRLEFRDVFVYVSSPVKQLRGGFEVGQVWKGPPDEIWGTVGQLAGVTRSEFNSYYDGKCTAFALEISKVWEVARHELLP